MPDENKDATPIWTAFAGTGAVILRDGVQVTIYEALEALNAASANNAELPNRMVKIDTMIAELQKISKRFGNTCVYIRRGGMSWGAVALNRRSDDEEYGVYDLQAQHDRDMAQRVGQVERLLTRLRELEEKRPPG